MVSDYTYHPTHYQKNSQFELKIAVIQSGQYKLVSTDEAMPVSAVYLLDHALGDKEFRQSLTLEMQHCARQNALSHLSIVRADEKSDVPYKFQVIPGVMVVML